MSENGSKGKNYESIDCLGLFHTDGVYALRIQFHYEYYTYIYDIRGATDTNKLTFYLSTGYVTHQQFNIQQLYVLPTLYLCVLYLSENKQRLVPLTA